jgi:hypothetical protein
MQRFGPYKTHPDWCITLAKKMGYVAAVYVDKGLLDWRNCHLMQFRDLVNRNSPFGRS